MDGTAETKICPFCAETIKAAAKKCPFCNSRLVRFAIFKQEAVLGISIVVILGAWVFAFAEMWPASWKPAGRSFDRYRKDLETKNLEIKIINRGTNEFYYDVIGIVTNKGEYPWQVRDIELTVTNAQGVRDIAQKSLKEPFVVQPGTEHAFAFECWTVLTNGVIGASGRVTSAHDGNALNNWNTSE
jgi:hypothetical protein